MTRPALPALWVRAGGGAARAVRAPADFGTRAWILGVVAVQVAVEEGQVVARLRSHVTGAAEPVVEALPSGSQVHVVLGGGEARLRDAEVVNLPPLASSQQARLSLFVDGTLIKNAVLRPDHVNRDSPPRAFGHVFCRWLREGQPEPGYDLTDFLSLASGVKYRRIANGVLKESQVVSYAFVSAPSGIEP